MFKTHVLEKELQNSVYFSIQLVACKNHDPYVEDETF